MKMQLMKEVMSRNVQVVSPDATLKDAAVLMRDKGIGMLPVGENDRMIGTITDRDIAIRAVADGKSVDSTVREVMTKELVWAYEEDTVAQGASKMSECQIRRLPVVNADKRLVGMVSLGDFAVDVDDMRISAQALEEISRD
jgi:CBS domain-containing protein